MFYNIIVLISYPYQHIVEKIIGYLHEKILMSNHRKITSEVKTPKKTYYGLTCVYTYKTKQNISFKYFE